MKKQFIIVGMAVLILTVGLSGCTQNLVEDADPDGDGHFGDADAFPNNPSEWKDTDGDGYGDNSDDFPSDSNLHKKTIWEDFVNEPVIYAEDLPDIHGSHDVTTNTKYVEWDWRLVSPSPYGATIEFEVYRRTESKNIEIYKTTAWADSNRIIPDYSDIGKWDYVWLNFPYPDEGWGTLYVTGTIYAVE